MKPALLLLLSCVAFAQTPVFDVADVHPSKPGAIPQGGMLPGSGRLEFRGFSLSELIEFAYGIDDDMITGAPKWLGFDRFDVFAKGKRGSSDETVKLMLRALLADRFKLVFHTVDKPMPAFVLTVGKRVLMKEAPEGEDSNCLPSGGGEDGQITVECTNLTMAAFAERFHQMAGGYLTHPVVDQTGLKGGYDFKLRWTARGVLDSKHEGTSFFEAAEKQLGLKLEEKKAPLPAMAIDSVNEVPTPNAPGVTETLTITATEFEVADIKKSAPGAQQGGNPFKPGGRIDIQAMSIKDILPFVYDVDANMIVGIPKFLETDRYSIVAKPPTEVSMDALRVMLRNLFVERFKIVTHKEEQPVQVWVMTVSKRGLKMEKSSGAGQGCKPGGFVNDMVSTTCKATTMAQFAEQFHRFAGGYLDHMVVDETGLTDSYDFEIKWTPLGRLQGMRAAPAGGGTGDAADPGGLSFFEAAERQLGLKFESQKRPMPVIVIDKASPLEADQ
jgi:uncharacterized protein (TIGR03435 family)